MKKISENRYQHSATLFKFCKEALEIRYEGNVKVIDQDVGAILGYDPADCSHWKKGKKNIRALSTLRSIADHLNIDEKLLIDITSGKIGLEEAVFEFKGYGKFALKGNSLEGLKKEFFKNQSKWQDEQNSSFEEIFAIDRENIAAVANALLTAGDFKEAPIYLPEVYQLVNNISLESDITINKPVDIKYSGDGEQLTCLVKFKGPEMRPYMRFLVAKELYKFICHSQNEFYHSKKNLPEEVIEVQSNIFAGMLLAPRHLIQSEVEKVDISLDLVQQLSDAFWISKSLMNQRLSDYMEYLD